MESILTGTITKGQFGPESYDNEVILNVPQLSKNGPSPLDTV